MSTAEFKLKADSKVVKEAIYLEYFFKELNLAYLALKVLNCNN